MHASGFRVFKLRCLGVIGHGSHRTAEFTLSQSTGLGDVAQQLLGAQKTPSDQPSGVPGTSANSLRRMRSARWDHRDPYLAAVYLVPLYLTKVAIIEIGGVT